MTNEDLPTVTTTSEWKNTTFHFSDNLNDAFQEEAAEALLELMMKFDLTGTDVTLDIK